MTLCLCVGFFKARLSNILLVMSAWKILSLFQSQCKFYLCFFTSRDLYIFICSQVFYFQKDSNFEKKRNHEQYGTILYLITLVIKDLLNWLWLYTLTCIKNIQRIMGISHKIFWLRRYILSPTHSPAVENYSEFFSIL